MNGATGEAAQHATNFGFSIVDCRLSIQNPKSKIQNRGTFHPVRGGQSTVEYAVLIAVVIGALLTMQIFVKRGAQGKLRDATDQIGEQFSPRGTTYKYTTTTASTRQEKLENTPGSSLFGKSTSTIVQRGGTQTGDTQTKTFVNPELVDTNQ